jgi:hypothetical protein
MITVSYYLCHFNRKAMVQSTESFWNPSDIGTGFRKPLGLKIYHYSATGGFRKPAHFGTSSFQKSFCDRIIGFLNLFVKLETELENNSAF